MNLIFFGRRKKKAVIDNIVIVISLFFLMVSIVFGFILYTAFNDKVQASTVITPEAKTASTNTLNKFSSLDTLFLFFWLCSFLGAVISAWFIDSHPAFFILSVIVLVIVLALLIPISNFIETLMLSSELAATTVQFPIIYYFVQNLFVIVVIQAFVILIALYSKSRSNEVI